MEISAKLMVTSYDLPKVDVTISNVMRQSSKINVTIKGKPVIQKVTTSSNRPKVWGCTIDDLKRKSIFVRGSADNLKKILKIQAPDGVYIQLLPQ